MGKVGIYIITAVHDSLPRCKRDRKWSGISDLRLARLPVEFLGRSTIKWLSAAGTKKRAQKLLG
jgi:hypothetical protein